jgi:hypothetical protein
LKRIAEATGGRSYVPSQITEVANAFAAIQEELRSQYAVSYKPAGFKADGHYRTIEVQRRTTKACASAAVKDTAALQNTTHPTSSSGLKDK